MASASYDESVRIWTSDPFEEDWFATSALTGHDSTVWSLDFDPFGHHFISAGDDCCLVLWKRTFGPNRLRILYVIMLKLTLT